MRSGGTGPEYVEAAQHGMHSPALTTTLPGITSLSSNIAQSLGKTPSHHVLRHAVM